MPYIAIATNRSFNAEERSDITREVSHAVSLLLGKPERYVMVQLESDLSLRFGGDESAAAYVRVASLSLDEGKTEHYAARLCKVVEEFLGVEGERVYIEFASPARHMWGYNGGTFG